MKSYDPINITPLGIGQTIVWNIIQIPHDSKELWPVHRVWICLYCDLDLKDMTLVKGHYKPFDQNNNKLRCYPDLTWQRGVLVQTWIFACTQNALTLEIQHDVNRRTDREGDEQLPNTVKRYGLQTTFDTYFGQKHKFFRFTLIQVNSNQLQLTVPRRWPWRTNLNKCFS